MTLHPLVTLIYRHIVQDGLFFHSFIYAVSLWRGHYIMYVFRVAVCAMLY